MEGDAVGSNERGWKLLQKMFGPAEARHTRAGWRRMSLECERYVVTFLSGEAPSRAKLDGRALRRALIVLACLGLIVLDPLPGMSQDHETQFRQLADQLAAMRRKSADEPEGAEEQALKLLDGIVLEGLNTPGGPELEVLKRKLGALVTRQPAIGEGYQVFRIGSAPESFALLANFGLSGPSAARIYAGAPQHFRLAARIDRFSQANFLDDYLELVPVDVSAGVFVTVAGRTDELQTGSFTAWRFDGTQVRALWTSDILAQSSYEVERGGFLLTYCAESDEDQPETCRRIARDRYVWDGAEWKRTEQTNLSAHRP